MVILYGVSPIGLGHATRAVAVGLKLKERGLEPQFATGGRAAAFLQSYGFVVHDVVTEPTPSENNGMMRYPSIWYLRYWRGYRASRSRMLALIETLKPTLVVGDEEFSSVSIALERRIPNVLISDELELGFAQSAVSRFIERRVSEWYTALQRNVPHLLVPDFGSDRGNIHFIEPIVRNATKSREDTLRDVGLDTDSRVVLLSASGSGIGYFLLRATLNSLRGLRLPEVKLVVTGIVDGRDDGKEGDDVRYLGVYRDNQNLVAAADLVISTAGKSTMDEAASFGSPLIAIPIKNHAEQERNAASLGFEYSDVSRLGELIPAYLGRRSASRNYLGAERASAYLANIAS